MSLFLLGLHRKLHLDLARHRAHRVVQNVQALEALKTCIAPLTARGACMLVTRGIGRSTAFGIRIGFFLHENENENENENESSVEIESGRDTQQVPTACGTTLLRTLRSPPLASLRLLPKTQCGSRVGCGIAR